MFLNVNKKQVYKETFIHHTGSGIVPYISYTSIQQHLLPKLWLKHFPSHRIPPDTGHRWQPFVRAGAPVVPRHKQPRYGVLSCDPPGRGPDTRWEGWWWGVSLMMKWRMAVSCIFFGVGRANFSQVFLGGLQVVFYFRFDVYTDIYIACLYII